MECMAIGGPNGNNPLANLFIKNNSTTGVAQNNQTDQVSSTEETSVDNITSKSAANSSERIAQLQKALGADGFAGRVDSNTLARIKAPGASPIASTTAIKFNETSGITATSAPEPSSVEAIGGPEVVAATTNDNAPLKLETTKLANLANGSDARTVKGDFNVSEANTSVANDNNVLAAALG